MSTPLTVARVLTARVRVVIPYHPREPVIPFTIVVPYMAQMPFPIRVMRMVSCMLVVACSAALPMSVVNLILAGVVIMTTVSSATVVPRESNKLNLPSF
jgi:hypothetical protein